MQALLAAQFAQRASNLNFMRGSQWSENQILGPVPKGPKDVGGLAAFESIVGHVVRPGARAWAQTLHHSCCMGRACTRLLGGMHVLAGAAEMGAAQRTRVARWQGITKAEQKQYPHTCDSSVWPLMRSGLQLDPTVEWIRAHEGAAGAPNHHSIGRKSLLLKVGLD